MNTAFHSAARFQAGTTRVARACALVSAMACATQAWAQQPPGPDGPEESAWGLGLAIGSGQAAYKGVDRENKVLPMVSYENQYVKLSGPTAELKLPGFEFGDSQRVNFGLVGHLFDGGGYKASDSLALAGMAERESSVWAGAKVEWENELADVKLELLGDVSSNSKGQRVVLGLERKLMVSPSLMLIPQIGVEWASKKYVDYYYGVRAHEVRAGRSAYVGESAVNPEIGLTGIYRLDKQQSLMFNVGVKSLDKSIKNSPIVDRSSESRVMLGYMYRF